jgi:hypothetical protein
LSQSGQGTIQYRDLMSRDDFTRLFAATSTPVILTNAMTQWFAAPDVWRLLWFREHYGDLQVEVRMGARGGSRRTSLGDYIDALERGLPIDACGYLAQVPLETFALLKNSVVFPRYSSAKAASWTFVWMGPIGSKTILHSDLDDNLIAQVVGRKHFLLYSPESTSRIPHYQEESGSYTSIAAWLGPNRPRPSGADYSFVLEAGQLLYLPPYWWHEVTSTELAISVNHFWHTPSP